MCIRDSHVGEAPVIMRERQGGVSSIHSFKSAYYMIKVTLALIIDRLSIRKDVYKRQILDGRLVDHDRLETTFQRGVFLDILAVLVQRGCTDAVQLAAGQHLSLIHI